MTAPTLTITRGLPGAGKTTYAKALVADAPDTWARVNRDDTRDMLYGRRAGLTWEQEQHVTTIVHTLAKTLLGRGMSVIADDMNLRPRYVREWRKVAAAAGAEFTVVEFPSGSLEEAIRGDAARAHAVGEDAVRSLWSKFTRGGQLLPVPEETEPPPLTHYTPRVGTPPTVLVDVDGTVARMAGRGPYDLHRVHEDTPITPIIDLVDDLRVAGYSIVFLSGREDTCREATEAWLVKHHVRVPGEPVYMRPEGDRRRDSIVKAELFDAHVRADHDVRYVLDDRDQVVKMWRSLGLTCLQVAEGNF